MRRSQTVRNHAKASSLAVGSDDLGALRENEDNEDILRRQLLEKDREKDNTYDVDNTLTLLRSSTGAAP